MMKDLLRMADMNRLTADRHFLHTHAETGFDLPQTFGYVWQALTEMGLLPRKCGRCGIIADIGQGGKCVLLRADMDALPIRTDGADGDAPCSMHACGHDLHTAMLLEAARMLKTREKTLGGRVRLMFQPAEELLLGAADMLEGGLLDGIEPMAALMIHVMTNVDIPVGTVIVSAPGVSAPAAEMFEIHIRGKGCHGAMPHTGIDPISAAVHTVLNLQTIQTRELSISQSCVLTIGMLQAGDTANVIPDQAVLRGSFRSFDDEARNHLCRRIAEAAEATAAIFGATAEKKTLGSCPTLINDGALSRSTLAALREMLGTERVLLSSELGGSAAKSSGSEDFAIITHRVPSLMVALAAGRSQEGYAFPLHHPQVQFDEAALPTGAAVYAAMALNALKS